MKNSSMLYNDITSINNEYNFKYDIEIVKGIKVELNSRRSLDGYDFEKNLLKEIKTNYEFYNSAISSIKYNREYYNVYINEYGKIKNYTTREQFDKLNMSKFKYRTYLKCEKRIFKKSKFKKPPLDFNVIYHVSYTTPTGRNHYYREQTFYFENLITIIYKINGTDKRIMKEEKREKEKKLRELDKIEKEIDIKKASLEKEKQEFENATKGHIYSKENIIESKKIDNIEIHDSDEPYIKLKKLKQLFDNGEISFEEYSNKKKEIL